MGVQVVDGSRGAGFLQYRIDVTMAARSIDSGDLCQFEYSLDLGRTWVSMLELDDTAGNRVSTNAVATVVADDDRAGVAVRMSITASGYFDFCNLHCLFVEGYGF